MKPIRKMFLTVLPFALGVFVLGTFPMLSAFAPAAERTLYFKLPIEGARFHWRFNDDATFLAGELTLRILNDGQDETHVVFRDGKIHDGWEVIDDERPEEGFYFGFASTHSVRTRGNDSLIITLTVPTDLAGRGSDREGILPAGVWQMSGSYSSIFGKRWNPIDLIVLAGEPPVAYMECWADVWPITITAREGWHSAMESEDIGWFRKLTRRRGTNFRLCGSHY